MSVIFPGNYVSHLNAYREQGVEALPGVEFYRAVGALVLDPDNAGTLSNGVLAAGTYGLKLLSPDLRQDDKPRKDKPMVIPAGATVYKVAVAAPGVREETVAGTATIEIDTPSAPTFATNITAEASGYFPENGLSSAMLSVVDGTPSGADATVGLTTDADLIASLDPSAGACRNSPSAIIVEVCWYKAAPAPSYDDAHIPYAVEAGQGY